MGPIQGPLARLMAGTLAVGEGALLSHRSAAELWGLGPAVRGSVSVIVVGRQVRSRDGIHVHHARSLEAADIAHSHGIPVTSPGRMLLDLATSIGRRDLARPVEESELLELLRGDWLDSLLARNPGIEARGRSKPSPGPSMHRL